MTKYKIKIYEKHCKVYKKVLGLFWKKIDNHFLTHKENKKHTKNTAYLKISRNDIIIIDYYEDIWYLTSTNNNSHVTINGETLVKLPLTKWKNLRYNKLEKLFIKTSNKLRVKCIS